MTLPALKQATIDRWLSAYDEAMPAAPQTGKEALKTFYAPNKRFELRDYNKDLFSEKRILSTERLPEYDFIYILDESGRPCYFEQHSHNKVGYYTYTDSLVEYVEYNVRTATPHCIQRLTYQEDKKISFQSLTLNRTIDPAFHGTTKTEIMDNLLKDEFAFYCAFELYNYTDNKISIADCLYITPAAGEYTLQQQYNYNKNGELDEILDTDVDNRVLYGYVRTPDNTTFQELSDQVAGIIATDIIKTLRTTEIPGPLAILQINFLSVGAFNPLLAFFTVEEQDEIEELQGEERVNALFSLDPEEILITDRSFERLLCAFMREVETLENYDLAVAMARKTAWLLNNNKLNNEFPITENFMVYATDWDVEPENFADVLRDCGLPEEEVDKWAY